jgi:hypothetical protein
MDMVFLGWAAFWLILGLLPIVVAAHRLRRAKRFRTLNRWILIAGLGQIGLPVAAVFMLMLGFPPVYAGRAESSFHFVIYFWAASFLAMWLLFITLGILCRIHCRAGGVARRAAPDADALLDS